jgi:Flp pilus assembly protein TadG
MVKRITARALIDRLLTAQLGKTMHSLCDRRAAVALMIAIMAPLLIAATGLVVDVGYWYQEEVNLQNAADAAALAMAQGYITYNATTQTQQTQLQPLAVAAANNATSNQYSLTSASVVITGTTTSWTATVTAPQKGFFSQVQGPGLGGFHLGTQSASATASVAQTTSPPCLLATGTTGTVITNSGGALVQGVNCTIAANSSSATSVTVSGGSGIIEGSSVNTVGNVSISGSNGYIGENQGTIPYGTSAATPNGSATADPLASMGTPPAWPAMQVFSSTAPTNVSSYITNSFSSSGTWGGCVTGSNPTCNFFAGVLSGLNNVNATKITFSANNYAGVAAETFITGGLGGNEQRSLVLAGSSYNIAGPGVTGTINTPTGWAWTVNTPTLTIAPGVDYVNGGMVLNGSNPVVTFGQGSYFFSSYSGSTPAMDDSNANITFTGGTYFFNGGLTVEGSGTIDFGPGIYYIENGDLNFAAGSHVTANGATFVLENGGSYQFQGGYVGLNLTGPTSNCVNPVNYPETAYSTAFPYDGTNGQGICGVLIYQARADTKANTINEGAQTTINGYVYAPSAALTVSGGATIAPSGYTSQSNPASITGALSIIAQSVTLNGSGTIILKQTGGGAGGPTTPTALLVQ